MIKKPLLWGCAPLIALATANAVSAHPTNIPYESRGKCEAAYAEFSKLDRERLVDVLGIFDAYGHAQRTFNELFACEYDEETDAWYIVELSQM